MRHCKRRQVDILAILILTALLHPVPVPAQDASLAEIAGSERARQMFERFPNRGQLTEQVPPRSPRETVASFKLAEGLKAEVVLHEPEVRQPVFLNFDERGRMWVVEFLQYPYPAGLKIVDLDHQFHATYDKVPPPPPYAVGSPYRGKSRISIHEDTNGDGSFDRHKIFLAGLSIVTAVEQGRGGVWVLHPPYLLFFADRDRDDRPDGAPVVHLAGFGMEDTHATANSLRFGPDGWLYGGQGSGCSATIRRPGIKEKGGDDKGFYFKGQAIWRYHPETRCFELFAEGGGNTFGLEFDAAGHAFSGHNGGDTRGFHFVQGGNYQKAWGEHGYLTNPYAFGYFGPMRHDRPTPRFSHTFIVYESGALAAYEGRIIAPVPLHNVVMLTERTQDGSTFFTRDVGTFLSSSDRWFRPVDIKIGPDGAVYIADWYDTRLSHMNPRDTWDKERGRIYRVRAKGGAAAHPFDLTVKSTAELVKLLSHSNKWFRQQALRLLADRREPAAIPLLRERVRRDDPRALDALWGLWFTGGFTDVAAETLRHPQPSVRRWTIRLLGDAEDSTPPEPISEMLVELASREKDPQVRSQLASTAKRLAGEVAVRIVREFLHYDADARDHHLPLLVWWALEAKAESHREQVLAMFKSPQLWAQPMVRQQNILERLARRYAAYPTPENQAALATLLKLAPDASAREVVTRGIQEAYRGRKVEGLLAAVDEALRPDADSDNSAAQALAVRRQDRRAIASALGFITRDDTASEARRLELIEALGDARAAEALPVLLELLGRSTQRPARVAALAALAQFDDASVAEGILKHWPTLDHELRGYAAGVLCRRRSWASELLRLVVEVGVIPRQDISDDMVQRIRLLGDAELKALADRYFGPPTQPTSEEKKKQMEALAAVLKAGRGDAKAGKPLYAARCGLCHKLFNEGSSVGPELTGYERTNLTNMILSIVDPSAAIREGFVQHHVLTKDGRSLLGIISRRDATGLTLLDPLGHKTIVPLSDIDEQRMLSTSIMPDNSLAGLSEQQLRDLFAYLQLKGP